MINYDLQMFVFLCCHISKNVATEETKAKKANDEF